MKFEKDDEVTVISLEESTKQRALGSPIMVPPEMVVACLGKTGKVVRPGRTGRYGTYLEISFSPGRDGRNNWVINEKDLAPARFETEIPGLGQLTLTPRKL